MKAKCKYLKKCNYYSKTSVTCNEDASGYCGIFRKFQEEERNDKN